jgi:NAD(P)-dependent dehydrogenase (short-subunit alcohol dehydrogenase family)
MLIFFCFFAFIESTSNGLKSAVTTFGDLHGVIQCAGVGAPSKVLSAKGAVHNLDHWNAVIAINLNGTFNVLRLATAIMAKQNPIDTERGVFINVASVAAFEGQVNKNMSTEIQFVNHTLLVACLFF